MRGRLALHAGLPSRPRARSPGRGGHEVKLPHPTERGRNVPRVSSLTTAYTYSQPLDPQIFHSALPVQLRPFSLLIGGTRKKKNRFMKTNRMI
jgi:hypothetical protein